MRRWCLRAQMKTTEQIRRHLGRSEYRFSRHAAVRAVERNIGRREIAEAGADAGRLHLGIFGGLCGQTAPGRGRFHLQNARNGSDKAVLRGRLPLFGVPFGRRDDILCPSAIALVRMQTSLRNIPTTSTLRVACSWATRKRGGRCTCRYRVQTAVMSRSSLSTSLERKIGWTIRHGGEQRVSLSRMWR